MDSTKQQSKTTENLYQVFYCFICMERVKNAHLCPHCSKLCCFHCINRWLIEKSHCPHCRHRLQLSDLVNCRWAEDFIKQVDHQSKRTSNAIDVKLLDATGTEKHVNDSCPDHNEKVNVYCWTCRCCICHQCALWSGNHSGHTFKPLDEIYDLFVTNLRASLSKLRSRYMQLNLLATRRRKNVHRSISEKNDAYRDLHLKMNTIIDNFECKVENEIFELIAKQVEIDNEVETVDNLALTIERNLNTYRQAELIISSKSFENKIDEVLKKPVQRLNNVAVDFSNELVPSFEHCTFLLKHYSLLQRTANPIFSESMHVNGLCWRLKLYPDGNGVSRGSYLSLFIELNYGPKGPLRYEYRVEMINQSPCGNGENFVREFTSEFDNEESWGYNRFFRIESLQTEGFLDPVSDTLKFRLYIRNPNYCEKTRDQAWAMNEMMELVSSPFYLAGTSDGDGRRNVSNEHDEGAGGRGAGNDQENHDDETLSQTRNETVDTETGQELVRAGTTTGETVEPVHQCDRNCRSYARACCRRLFHFNDILNSEPNREMAQQQQQQHQSSQPQSLMSPSLSQSGTRLQPSTMYPSSSSALCGHYGAIGSGRGENSNVSTSAYSMLANSSNSTSTVASARELRRRLRRYAPGSQHRRSRRGNNSGDDDDDEDDEDDEDDDDDDDNNGHDGSNNNNNNDDDIDNDSNSVLIERAFSNNRNDGNYGGRAYDSENYEDPDHDWGQDDLNVADRFLSLNFNDPETRNRPEVPEIVDAAMRQWSCPRPRQRSQTSTVSESASTSSVSREDNGPKPNPIRSMQSKYPNFCKKCLEAAAVRAAMASTSQASQTGSDSSVTAARSTASSSLPSQFFIRIDDE